MTYTLDFLLGLGTGKTGLTDLRAQLFDTEGSNVGSAVSTGFVEIGSGNYLWHYASIPDAHRGGVKFYSDATPTTILAANAINPEEAERVDGMVTSRLAPTTPGETLTVTSGAATATVDASTTADIAAIKAKTDTIGAQSVTITSPVSSNLNISLMRGDDYLLANGRELSFVGTNWPSLTSGSVNLNIATHAPTTYSGCVSGSNTCYIELTHTQTALLPAGTYNYELDAILTGSARATLVTGQVSIARGIV
jgi:hypothetical protein